MKYSKKKNLLGIPSRFVKSSFIAGLRSVDYYWAPALLDLAKLCDTH